MTKEEIAGIICKGHDHPSCSPCSVAKSEAKQIWNGFLSWLAYNAPEYVWQKFKDEKDIRKGEAGK